MTLKSSKGIVSLFGWNSFSNLLFVIIQAIVFLVAGFYFDLELIGLFSLALSFVFVPISIVDQSVEFGIIQSCESTKMDHSAVVNFNLLVSSLILIAGLGMFYCFWEFNEDVFLMTLALSPILILNSFTIVNNAIHKKNLDFVKIAKMESCASLAYLFVFLLFIRLEFGIWSLVYAILSKFIISYLSIFLFRYQSFSYTRIQKGFSTRQFISYSKFILAERSFAAVLSYIDVWILSTVLGLAPLGQYELLKKIILRPILVIYGALENVSFALLVKFKNDLKGFRKIITQHNYLSMLLFMNYFLIIGMNAKLIANYLNLSFFVPSNLILWISLFGVTIILLNPLDIILYSVGLTKKFFYWMVAYSIPLILVSIWSAGFGLIFYLKAQIVFYTILYILAFFIIMPKKYLTAAIYFIPFLYFLLTFTTMMLVGFYWENWIVICLITLILIAVNSYMIFYVKKS